MMGRSDGGPVRADVGPAGRGLRRWRALAGVSAAAAVVVASVLVLPWLSASASATTEEPCSSESSEPPLGDPSCSPSSPPLFSSSDPPCETSAGVYSFPASGTSRFSLPPWLSVPDSHVCVVLDASSLTDSEAPPPITVEELSSSLDSEPIVSAINSWRELFLYSVGILVFLGGALVSRSRVG